MTTLFSLDGRRAVVTGAASGIGAAIANHYAAAGARLLLADRDAARLALQADACRAAGATVETVQADVGDETGANRIVDRCIEAFGGIDILVNNAGMLTQARCTDLTTAMWDDMMRVDLRSVFLYTRRALPSMTAQRWGRVINVASQLGIKGGAELSHYSAAKAGVIGFTKSLALEVAPAGTQPGVQARTARGPVHVVPALGTPQHTADPGGQVRVRHGQGAGRDVEFLGIRWYRGDPLTFAAVRRLARQRRPAGHCFEGCQIRIPQSGGHRARLPSA